MTKLSGTFALNGFDEDAVEEAPTKITSAVITQAWSGGDVDGEAVCRNLMHYAPDETASIVGLVRFTGTIGDRKGSFVAQSTGSFDGETMHTDLTVLPGSGSGDLSSVSGTGVSAAPKGPEGTWTLDLNI